MAELGLTNYISNGDFSLPVLNSNAIKSVNCPTYWNCSFMYISHLGPPMFNSYSLFGQALGLKNFYNGNLSQNIVVPFKGKCTLQYYAAKRLNDVGAMFETRWNGVRISLRTPVNVPVFETL